MYGAFECEESDTCARVIPGGHARRRPQYEPCGLAPFWWTGEYGGARAEADGRIRAGREIEESYGDGAGAGNWDGCRPYMHLWPLGSSWLA